MDYAKTALRDILSIHKIYTVHYFEYSKNYIFDGERHDFWEFLYVDKGEITVKADEKAYSLKRGDIIFHRPNEFHNVQANGVTAPNLVVISFECVSPAMDFFAGKILHLGDAEKNMLTSIVNEAMEAFSSDLSDPLLKKLEKRPNARPESEQLIKLHLCLFLITMLRKGNQLEKSAKISTVFHEKSGKDKLGIVIEYLERHARERISQDDICRATLMSRSALQKLFKDHTGESPMDYARKIKIDAAKTLMREGFGTISEISNELGYASIHYFSRQFHAIAGMTPREYAGSVKAICDGNAET